MRVTSAGWYYSRHLVREFSYLALVLQDTPFDDLDFERTLRESLFSVGNIGDREDNKLSRMQERFSRVERFLTYLAKQEEDERRRYGLDQLDSVVAEPIVGRLTVAYERQRDWIAKRLRENRERLIEAEPLAIYIDDLPAELEAGYDATTEDIPDEESTDVAPGV